MSGSANTGSAPALTGDGNAANAANNANANSTTTSPAPSANAPATTDSGADAATNPSANAAGAAAFNAAVVANGLASANSVTAATAKAQDGKDEQDNDAADSANDPSMSKQAQSSLDAVQPVAAAIVGNVAADAASSVAKGGAAIADAVKGRGKIPTAAPAGQNAPAQDGNTDTTAAASATDSSATDSSAAAASGAPTDNSSESTTSAQQAPDQPQAPGASIATLWNQIDAASSSGAERLGSRVEATASPGSAVVSTSPASANSTVAPNFGLFAANAMVTNGTATAAAGGDTAVPLADLAVAIAARAQGGSSQFDIRLDPPDLGRIEVQLSVDSNGQVTSHITADRQDTLNLLQNQQPQLQQALQQAGLKTSDNGLQFSLRDQSFAGQQQNQNFGQNGNSSQSNTQQIVVPDSSLSAVDTAQIYSRLNLRSGIDIRV